MPRTAPKFLFELSAREARELLLNLDPARLPTLTRTLERLQMFLSDAQQAPLSEGEEGQIGSWWADTDATDLVTWNLPPGQVRREYLECGQEPEGAAGTQAAGPENTSGR